jgi:hypothetical protein
MLRLRILRRTDLTRDRFLCDTDRISRVKQLEQQSESSTSNSTNVDDAVYDRYEQWRIQQFLLGGAKFPSPPFPSLPSPPFPSPSLPSLPLLFPPPRREAAPLKSS